MYLGYIRNFNVKATNKGTDTILKYACKPMCA